MDVPSPSLVERVRRLLSTEPVAWRRVARGYTAAERWIVTLTGDESAFVKVATADDSAEWLRAEWRIYSQVQAPYLAAVLGWEDAERPVLVLEDLTAAHWPPPWEPGMVEIVLETLGRVADTPPPPGLLQLRDLLPPSRSWERVAAAPEPFLALGFCLRGWLETALPELLKAAGRAPLDGDTLLHCDTRSDNICIRGGSALLVDWNHACLGNPAVDVACWLPSLHLEGGPWPGDIMPDEPGLAAWLAGFWAARAGQPDPWPGSQVREIQRRQLGVALPWAAASLGLPPPEAVTEQGRGYIVRR